MTIAADQTIEFSNVDKTVYWLGKNWILVINLLLGLYVIVPFLAPAFMAVGLTIPGRAIYWIYSFLCHQLPERSYFLFGSKISYTLPEIQAVWQNTDNIAILRQFVGNTQMGWKVAWSDRMVSMFTSLWIFGILWGIFKKKIKVLPLLGLALLLLPMAIDGTTHFVSDPAGIGQGFRDSNIWLGILTNHTFAANFYAGDAWGSFNAWTRLISGILFGLGIVWFGFPCIDEAFKNSAEVVVYKYHYRALLKKEKERMTKLVSDGVFLHDESGLVMQKGDNGDRM